MKTPGKHVSGFVRVLRIVILLFLLIVVLVVLLPAILSIRPVNRFVFEQISASMDASLTAESCSLGWLRGVRVENLVFRDEALGVAVRAPGIDAPAGLLRLVRHKMQLGVVRIEQPVVTFTLPEPPAEGMRPPDVERAPESRPGGGEERPVPPKRGQGVFKLPNLDIAGRVEVVGGRIECVDNAGNSRFVVDDVTIDLAADGLETPVHLGLKAGTALSADADIDLFSEGVFVASGIRGTLKAGIDDLDLEPVGRVIRHYVVVPDVSGKLKTTLDVAFDGAGGIRARGTVKTTSLEFKGAQLGEDTPSIGTILVDFDLASTSDGMTVSRFTLDSLLASASLAGEFHRIPDRTYPVGFLTATGRADVAAIATRFPRTLGVREDIVLRSGSVVVEARMESEGERLQVAGVVETRGIEALHESRLIALAEPVRVKLDAYLDENGPVLKQLEVTSSFARAKGSGNLNEAGLTVALNLSAAIDEVGKFIDLGGLGASGAAEFSVGLSRLSDRETRLDGNAAVRDLVITGLTPAPITHSELRAQIGGLLPLVEHGIPTSITEFSGNVTSDLFRARLGAARLAAPSRGRIPVVTAGEVSVETSLADIERFIETVLKTNMSPSVDGALSIRVMADTDPDTITVSSLKADLTDMVLKKEDRTYSESEVSLGFSGKAHLVESSLTIDSVSIASGLVSLTASGALEDMRNDRIMDLSGTIECDFSDVAALVALFSDNRIEMAGKAPRAFRVRASLAGKGFRELLASMEAEAGLYIEKASLFGIALSDLEPVLVVRRSVATLSAEAAINEGRLTMSPVLDVRDEKPLFSLPEDSQVLLDVKLTDEMSTQLLSLIHPVFKECTVLGGDIDLLMSHCRVPVEERFRQTMTLGGNVSLSGVKLMPGGMLARVFDIVKLRGAEAVVPDQDVSFNCRNGRVEATPLKLISGPYAITVSGTTGVDGTLDHVVEVPVTEGMVSADVYRYVADATLKIVIKGTVSRPVISRDSLDTTLGELLRQAAKKALVDETAKKALIEEGGKMLDKLLKDGKFKF